MENLKQYLLEETKKEIDKTEKEIKESDEELKILNAKFMVEKKALNMKDIKEYLKEDFEYSAQALEDMIVMEKNKNAELKKEIEILKYRKAVIESQFSDNEFIF